MIKETGQSVLINRGSGASTVGSEIECLVTIVQVCEQAVRLIPDTEIEGESLTYSPRIAKIPARLRTSTLLVFAAVLGEKRECAQQKVGSVITCLIP